MIRIPTLLVSLLGLALPAGLACGSEIVSGVTLPTPMPGGIVVHLRGPLQANHFVVAGSAGRQQTLRPVGATIDAGGTMIKLDWRGDNGITDEIAWWNFLRHGDTRQVQADVTGRLIFQYGNDITSGAGVLDTSSGPFATASNTSQLAPVPVVIVDSIRFRLVSHTGVPVGNTGQFNRKRVWSGKSGVSK